MYSINITKIILITLLAVGCSSKKQKPILGTTKEIKPFWFEGHKNKVPLDDAGDVAVHPFFDGSSQGVAQILNSYIVTKAGSEVIYDFDLLSGKRVSKAPACKQSDVWNLYKREINTLNFNIGIIPKVVDPKGLPQRVFIFGEVPKVKKGYFKHHTHLIRLIGGINLQYGPKASCRGRDWKNDIVPLAIFMGDEKYRDLNDVYELKEYIDINYFKAYVQNFLGRVQGTRLDEPSFRLLSFLDLGKTLKTLKSVTKFLDKENIYYIKKNCIDLYDNTWSRIREIKKEKKHLPKTKEEMVKNFDNTLKGLVSSKKERPAIDGNLFSQNMRGTLFSKWFQEFYKEKSEEFEICSRYVRHSGAGIDNNRHGFFLYLDVFMKLNKMGFVYSCGTRSWNKNYKGQSGNWVYDQSEYLKGCSDRDLDRGFEVASSYMKYQKNSELPFYTYILKDSGIGGSKEGIYSWIYRDGKYPRCSDDVGKMFFDDFKNEKINNSGLDWERFSIY